MPKKILSLALSALLLNLCVAPGAAAADKKCADASAARAALGQADADAKAVEKIKKKVAEIGTAKREFVHVKLRGGRKELGYISEIAEDHFVFIEPKTGTPADISYAQVEGLRRTRLNEKTMTILGITSAALLGVILGVAVYGASRE